MKKLIHAFPILILFFSCGPEHQYSINGSLSEKGTGDWIYLIDPGQNRHSIIDSAKINDKDFQFRGDIDLPELYLLSYQIDNFYQDIPIFLESGKFDVKLDIQDFKLGSIIQGGRFNYEYQLLLNQVDKNSSTQRFDMAVSEENYMETYWSFVKAGENNKERELDYIGNNPDSPISVYLLSKYKYELSLEEKGEFIENFGEGIHHMSLYKMMKSEYDNQVALLNFTPAYEVNDEGVKQIEIDFSNSTILHTLINKNPGKVMYIDVWGTWCGPCKAAFPELKSLRDDIPSDDLIFVYLCARSMREEWEKAIAKEQLIGQHYLLGDTQLKRLRGQLGKAEFLSYPTYIIINKDGMVCKWAPKPHLQKTEELLKTLVSDPA